LTFRQSAGSSRHACHDSETTRQADNRAP
jgi:hypothetical protein